MPVVRRGITILSFEKAVTAFRSGGKRTADTHTATSIVLGWVILIVPTTGDLDRLFDSSD
jgi:hypothetical protein